MIIRIGLFLILPILHMARPARAEAFAFAACEAVTASQNLSTQEFGAAMATEYARLAALSNQEIEGSIRCLEAAAPGADCTERLDYFLKALPVEWTLYRQNLALTGYRADYVFRTADVRGGPVYNVSLAGANPLWFGGADLPIEALTVGENSRVGVEWHTQLRRIRLHVRKALESKQAADRAARRSSYDGSSIDEALKLLEQEDLSLLMRVPNLHIQWYLSLIQNMVFHVNKKRQIRQLSLHPLLGVLAKAELDRSEIVRALGQLQEHLIASAREVREFAALATNPQPRVSQRGGEDLLDYLSVTESLLGARPDLCGVATNVMTMKLRREWIKTLGLVAAGGVLLFTAPMVAVPGFAILQTYSLTSSALTASASANRAFTAVRPEMAFGSVEEAYLDGGQLNTEILLSPLILSGVSVFKAGNFLKVLKP